MQDRRVRALRVHAAMRFFLAGIALVGVYFGGAGAAFYYRHRLLNGAIENVPPPVSASPNRATRLLVFAPHCDDEILGCGGLIQQTHESGGAVRTVILTNGDGFRTAVERQARTMHIGPSDYIQFASLRQQESLNALNLLGETAEDTLFLGYPDRGLMPMWNAHWLRSAPFFSAYTQCDRSPYSRTFDHNANYCGQDVLSDIKAILRAYRPTLITVTHPAEDHLDHAAAAAFVTEALRELAADPGESAWAAQAQLRYYLIHRGDWPLPQGSHLEAALLPPVEMLHVDTRWTSLRLNQKQTRRKAEAIARYPSQTSLMGHFLMSFARRNEIYGDIQPTKLSLAPSGAITMTGRTDDWGFLSPAILDPVRDNVLRDLQGGGDIRTVTACRDLKTLFLRIDTRQPISSQIDYTVHIRYFGAHGETSAKDATIRVQNGQAFSTNASNIRVSVNKRSMEISIPWDRIAFEHNQTPGQALALNIQTHIAGVEIDKTGVRFLTF